MVDWDANKTRTKTVTPEGLAKDAQAALDLAFAKIRCGSDRFEVRAAFGRAKQAMDTFFRVAEGCGMI